MHTASNLYDIKMVALGWPSSCNTGIKVTLPELASPTNRASPGHVTKPFLWVVLSHSLHMKAWEFAIFVVCLKITVTHGVCTWKCWSLSLSQFEQKNATCLEVHFDQQDFKKSPFFGTYAMKLCAPFDVKSNRLTSILAPIKLSNCRNSLYYAATHRMSFPSLKQSHLYLRHDHGILCHCMRCLALDNWGQKYCKPLGYKPNLSILQCGFQCLILPVIKNIHYF